MTWAWCQPDHYQPWVLVWSTISAEPWDRQTKPHGYEISEVVWKYGSDGGNRERVLLSWLWFWEKERNCTKQKISTRETLTTGLFQQFIACNGRHFCQILFIHKHTNNQSGFAGKKSTTVFWTHSQAVNIWFSNMGGGLWNKQRNMCGCIKWLPSPDNLPRQQTRKVCISLYVPSFAGGQQTRAAFLAWT